MTTPSGKPADPRAGGQSPDTSQPMSPGDEVRPGTPGAGQAVCRRCAGSGQVEGKPCPDCEGTGYVTVGIGGA